MASRFLLFACCLVEADVIDRLGGRNAEILERGFAIGRECA